jgi:protein LTV1
MQKEYAEHDSMDDGDDGANLSGDDSDSAPELITTREDFESMIDDFLDNYELLGRKMKPVLPGDNGLDKLNTLRRALGQDERVRIGGEDEDGSDEEEILMPYGEDDKKDRWDCETILSKFWGVRPWMCGADFCEATYSNLENHPRLIRARDNKPVPKITLDPRTGLPTVLDQTNVKPPKGRRPPADSVLEEDEDGQRKSSVYTL